ncbi:MAG: hypothetical protein HYX68_27345 [Planctomycetes bacterium]|nr:hypothetical protein [Planctomycetota bacterium]
MNEAANQTDVVLNGAFQSIGRLFKQMALPPVFFLALHPLQWAVRYYGLEALPDADAALQLESLVAAYPSQVNKPWDIDNLDQFVRDLAGQNNQLTAERFLGGAVAIMSKQSVILGCSTPSYPAGAPRQTEHWNLDRCEKKRFLWFQHTLDFAYVFRFSSQDFMKARAREGPMLGVRAFDEETKTATVVEVRRYMSIEQLVSTDTVLAFLAEYLFSTGGQLSLDYLPSDLCHYFVPLAGIGQWRTALCWLGMQHTGTPKFPHILVASLNEHCSQSMISAFGTKLAQTLIEMETLTSPLDKYKLLSEVFATLWWSREIALFDSNQCVYCAVRDGGPGLLNAAGTSVSVVAHNKVSNFLTRTPCPGRRREWIQLDLTILEVAGPDGPARLEKGTIRERLQFDSVRFLVDLLDEEIDVPVYGPRIADQIASVIIAHSHLRLRTQGAAMGAVGHTFKNAVLVTNWQAALNGLRQLPEPHPLAVSKAIRSLASFLISEGLGQLWRVVGLCLKGEFDKIQRWTDDSVLQMWMTQPAEVLKRYERCIEDFVAAVCYGLNSHDDSEQLNLKGFWFAIEASAHGIPRQERWVPTDKLPRRSVKDWFSDLLPPFVLEKDAYTALLATLIEPVKNAHEQLYKEKRAEGLYVHVSSSHMPNYLLVCFGNETSRPPERLPPGVVQAQTLFSWTEIATIQEIPPEMGPVFEHAPRGKVYWIGMQLHPHRLAKKILATKK